MVLNIQGNQTEPETTIGRFGLEEKDPTVGIDLPEGLINDYFKTVQSSPDGLYPELPTETSTTEPITEPSATSQTEKLFSKKPKLRPPKPTIRPKRRPGSVSPIDKILELNYLLEGRRDLKSKKSQVLSGLNSLTESGRKAIKGFFDNAAGGESNLDPTKDYWCAAFVAHVLSELGADPLKSKDRYDRLRADKYRDYGSKIESFEDAKEGDIVVWDIDKDGKGDHVTFYAGDRITSQGDKDPYTGEEYINVVGGNHDMGEVSLRENHPMYTKDRVLAIRRITYNDIDFNFTEQMAKQDPVFKKFIPDYASLDTDPADFVDDDLPSFDEGGLAQDDQMGILGFSAQGVQQEVDKYVDKDAEPAKDITFKDAAKFVAELTPIIGDAMAAKEVYDELQKDDPNYFLAGALGGAAIIGLIPGIGDAAAKAIKAGAKKALDVGKNVEIDPTAISAFGAGAIKKKPTIKEGVPTIEAAGLTDEAIETWRKKNKTSDEFRKSLKGRNPELQELAKGVSEGRVFSSTYRKRADELRPIRIVKEVPKPATNKEIVSALNDKQRRNPIIGLNEKVSTGEMVNVRLNIPAYTDYDVWVPTIRHNGKEKYKAAVRIKNVNFIKPTLSDGAKRTDSSKALKVAEGGEKNPFAVMTGEYVEGTDDELFTMAKEVFDSDEWTQVGYDPIKRGFFYDRETGQAILEADEVIQVGHLVLAKNAKKTDPDVFPFNKGGAAMKDQMQMAFKDDGMTKDPVSGNEIPPGSLAKEVRDDIPAMLSEGEYVVPADVLRYYGVNFFENLRNQAKSGLQTMEETGRIGGEPLSPSQVQQNMSGQRMAGAPPVQPVAANTGPAMLGQQSQTGTNTATTGQPVQNQFTPMNFSTVGFSQFQQPNQKPVSVTTTKTYVNANNTSDTRIVTYVDGAVTPPTDVKYTQPPYYLQGSPGLAEAMKGAPKGGGGGGGGGGAPDPEPKDPNVWAKNITNPEEWAEENLQGKANNLINTIKLGTSVARVNAMAELAKAQGNTDLYNSLKGKADDFVAANPVLNSLPNAWIDGDKIAADLQKDKDLVNSIFSIEKEIAPSKDPDPKKPSVVSQTEQAGISSGSTGETQASRPSQRFDDMTTEERAAAVEEETGVEVSGEQTAAGAGLSDPETGDTTTSSAGPFNKGGLMQRKKRKAKK